MSAGQGPHENDVHAAKSCSTCHEIKPLDHYWRCKGRKDGRQTSCRECQGEHLKQRDRKGYGRRLYRALRQKVLAHYGDACVCCGETNFEFLAIDHVHGGGQAHRREVGGGASFLRWLRDSGYPPGFRVMCHNCNMALGFYGYCPHRPPASPDLSLRLNRGTSRV